MKRKGDWIATATGNQFWPMDPRPDEIYITDIALSLSKICRWTGHVSEFISVAQHCVNVSNYGKTKNEKRWGLLHDAAEAYIGDMSSPLKKSMPKFCNAEEKIVKAVARKFGLSLPWPKRVDDYDWKVGATEAKQFMHQADVIMPHVTKHAIRGFRIEPWSPEDAYVSYLETFSELFI